MSKVSKCSLISEAVVSDSLCFSLPDFLKRWIICLSHMPSCLFYLVGTVVRINSRINSVAFWCVSGLHYRRRLTGCQPTPSP